MREMRPPRLRSRWSTSAASASGTLARDFAGGGIDDVEPFRGVRVGPLAVDVVRELGHGRCSNSHDDASAIAKNVLREFMAYALRIPCCCQIMIPL